MLSKEENALLTRTGPGTPMGELFRRFWLPAIVATEAEVDGPPVRLRIMSEDLIAFRDSKGNVGIVDAYCRHKLAGLFWGRNEEEGIRCTYHGWKYDTAGNCIDMPNEPADSNFKNKIKLKAYPTREWGGLIWVYMGPVDKMPELPQFEWARVPADHRHVSRWLQRTNWCQGLEGEFDNAHVSYLHKSMDVEKLPKVGAAAIAITNRDGTPKFTVRETAYGFIAGMRRDMPSDIDMTYVEQITGVPLSPGQTGRYWWMLTQYLLPTYSLVAQPHNQRGGRIWVPIDDYHTQTFGVVYSPNHPLSQAEHNIIQSGFFFPPRTEDETKFQMRDGYVLDISVPTAKKENDYLVDRDMQKTINFTGIAGINEQDRSIQETMRTEEGLHLGANADRTKEHLGTADIPTIAARRILIKMARDLQNGREPEAATNGNIYHVRAVPRVSDHGTLDEVMTEFGDEASIARV